ncbi:MAG: isoprenylcysteine carboxylmethyltransferase family protein [Thermoplasmata archaeon]
MNPKNHSRTRAAGRGAYAPEIFAGLLFSVAIPFLIGAVLEPQLLGLPVFASPERLISGGILLFLGLVIGFGGVFYLAREVGPGFGTSPPRLCGKGPYAYVRNPAYLGGVIVMAGLALILFSPIIPVYAALIWIRLHLVVVRFEEPMLARIFGEEYQAYRKQAGRWLPRLRRG